MGRTFFKDERGRLINNIPMPETGQLLYAIPYDAHNYGVGISFILINIYYLLLILYYYILLILFNYIII